MASLKRLHWTNWRKSERCHWNHFCSNQVTWITIQRFSTSSTPFATIYLMSMLMLCDFGSLIFYNNHILLAWYFKTWTFQYFCQNKLFVYYFFVQFWYSNIIQPSFSVSLIFESLNTSIYLSNIAFCILILSNFGTLILYNLHILLAWYLKIWTFQYLCQNKAFCRLSFLSNFSSLIFYNLHILLVWYFKTWTFQYFCQNKLFVDSGGREKLHFEIKQFAFIIQRSTSLLTPQNGQIGKMQWNVFQVTQQNLKYKISKRSANFRETSTL